MHRADYDDFCKELDRLAKLYRQDEPDDELTAIYWDALRDLSLNAVRACAKLHTQRSKFFPKPAELRPKSEMPKDPVRDDGSFAAGETRSIRNWDEQLRANEPLAKWHLLAAYLGRTDQIHPLEALYDERMRFCREVARKLLEQYGQQWCTADPQVMHAASRLLGGEFVLAVSPPSQQEAV